MSSARLITAVTLFLIIARGQARPTDVPGLQDVLHTKEAMNDTVPPPAAPELEEPTGIHAEIVTENLTSDTSKAPVANEQTLSSETFTGGDSESTVTTPHTPTTQEEESFIGRTISQDGIPFNDSDPIRKLDGVPEEKSEDELISTVSHNNEDSHFIQNPTSTILSDPLPKLDTDTAPSFSENIDVVKPFNSSISTELPTTEPHTLSTLLTQKHTSEDKDSKIQITSIVDTGIHATDVTTSIHEASPTTATPNTTQASPSYSQPTPLPSHDLHTSDSKKIPITERPDSIQLSNGADITETFGHKEEEEPSSRNIEIDAEGTEGKSSNKGPTTSSHQSDWLFTAVTVAVAMDGIVKAFSSSSPSLKNDTSSTVPLSASSLSEGQLSESSFVDPSISKSTPSTTSSLLPSLSLSSAELPDSSFVDTRNFKDQSISPSILTEKRVSSSMDTILAPFGPTSSTSDSSQVSKEVSDPSFTETMISKDSSFSMTKSASDSPQESIEELVSPSLATNILKDASSSPSLSTSTLTQGLELPVSSYVDASISMPMTVSNGSASLTPSSASPLPQQSAELPQQSAELPASSMVDIKILEDPSSLSSKTVPLFPASAGNSFGNILPSKTEPSHVSEEVPVSSVTETKILKDSTSSLTQTSEEVAASSSEDATAPSPLTSTPLSHTSEPTSFFVDTTILENSPSPLPLVTLPASTVPEEMPLSSSVNGPSSDANSLDNAPVVTSSFEMLPVMTGEKRDTADLLKFADMGDDMDVAETMIFRPIYSYRQDSARRRIFRSLADQR